MKKPQIYGWTDNHRDGETYVRYVMAFEHDDGLRLNIRNGDGVDNEIVIPRDKAAEFVKVLRHYVGDDGPLFPK